MIQGDPFGQGYDPKMGIPGAMASPQPAPQAAPQREPDALDALIQKLLAQQEGGAPGGGLAQRTGKLDVPFGPMSSRPNPLQFLLRGAVSGYNGRAGAASGANPKIEQLLRLQESKRYHDIQDTNADQRLGLADKLGANKIADTGADNVRGDANLQRMMDVLSESMRHNRVNEGQGTQRIQIQLGNQGIARERLGLSKQAEGRRAQVAAAYPKWSPQMKMEHDSLVRAAFTQFKDDPESLDAALDQINTRFLSQSQQIQNPFQDKYMPGGNTVKTGKSSTAKSLKTSQTPGLDAKTKAFYEAQGD